MTPRVSVCLVAVCGIFFPNSLSASEDLSGDEQLLRAAGIATDDHSLLDFFRTQTADDATVNQVSVLIERLGSDSFPAREKASADLPAFGPMILPKGFWGASLILVR